MRDLVSLLVALCVTELVHNAIEVWGMRQKVQWLAAASQGQEPGRWPIDVNSRAKTVLLHGFILATTTGLTFFGLQSAKLTEAALATLGIAVLLASYAYTTYKVDRFHAEIGCLISQAKKSD